MGVNNVMKKNDGYYNSKDVFIPKDYQNEQPEGDDWLNIEEGAYLLIHPKCLEKEFQTRQYQLVKLISVHGSDFCDSYFVDDITVRLACNGNQLQLYPFNIMGVAHEEDIELWKELYGDIVDKSSDIFDPIYNIIADAIHGSTSFERFISDTEKQIRLELGLDDDYPIKFI